MTFEQTQQSSEKSCLNYEHQTNPAYQLSEVIVNSLLDKLGSDDQFRDLFQNSPREALASLGHEAAIKSSDGDPGIWICFIGTKLASPEAIKRARNQLLQQLLSEKAAYNPVNLQG